MKAAAYRRTGGPDVFEYVDVPDPVLRPGGIILEVKAVGIQGGDLLHRAGGEMASVPHVVGYQAAGIVREVGADVTELAVGQPVVATMGSRQPRRARQRPGGVGVGRSGRPVARAGGGRADRVRHGRRLPVRVRPPAGRRDRARPGRGRRGRPRRDPAGQGRRREARAGDGVERRSARAAARLRHGPRHQLRDRRRRCGGTRADRRPRRRPRRRPGRRAHARVEHRRPRLPRADQLGGPSGSGRRPTGGVAVDAEERLPDGRVPRRRDGRRPGAHAAARRRACWTGWPPASCASRSIARSRSPTPPTRTATSRAARRSVASSSCPEQTVAREA